GRHDRVVARDVIVPAKKDRAVDVFDIEPGQLRAADKTSFAKTGGARLAPLGLSRLLNDEVGQAGVWASVVRATPLDLYRDHKAAIAEFRAAFKDLRAPNPNIVGVAVAVGDAIAVIEVFGSPALFASQLDRVLESAALEAIVANDREIRFPSDLTASPLAVKRLGESVFGADPETEGDAVVLRRSGRALGRILTAGGEPVRVLIFPDGPESRRWGVDLAIAPPKVSHVLQAYMARLQQPSGNRKPAFIREMAMLPGADARNAVISMAKGPYRKEAVEALGLRGDPAAGEVLVRWLKESRKEGQAMYPELAKALAHIASEEGAQALAEDLDGKDVRIAKAAAENLPGLLNGLRNLNALETVMTNAITALSRIDATPDSHGTTWPHRALMALTQKNFAKPSEYSLWWSLPNNRADFLERFTLRR
ncbi:MAG TPA: HEAT repeat domain-containing protein, partial [Planctomycetota bacterium]|nr:HEAT repeat domain-containing protein [Planctomycetota bacterium]